MNLVYAHSRKSFNLVRLGALQAVYCVQRRGYAILQLSAILPLPLCLSEYPV